MTLGGSKATPNGVISVNILKPTVNIHLPYITNITNPRLPDELQIAEVRPIFKKKDDLNKENYRPISVLPQVPKVFKKLYHQIINFVTVKLKSVNTI